MNHLPARLLLVSVLVASAGFSGKIASGQPTELAAQFESRIHSTGSFQLPYRLFVPGTYDSTQAYPVVLAFHGAGERGTNNSSHISVHRLATAWADTRVQNLYAPIVVAPQAPPGGRWEDVVISPSGSAGIRNEMTTVLAILDSLEVEFNVDPDRIYVVGLSLGGYGTFDAVFRDPTRFAGAVPMSGGYSPALASGMPDVPFWIIHGENDGTVPVSLSKGMITAWEILGRQTLYTNCDHFGCSALSPEELDDALSARPDLVYWGVPGVGHGPWAPWFDDPRVQDWLLSQHRQRPSAVTITSPAGFTTARDTLRLEWTADSPQDSVDIWFSPNRGNSWQRVIAGTAGDQFFEVDALSLPATPFGQFQVMVFDDEGFMYGRDRSPIVAIDNGSSGPPVAEIDRTLFKLASTFTGDDVDLSFFAGDAESAEVDVSILFSTDDGNSYAVIDEFLVQSDGTRSTRTVDLASLPNTPSARFRLDVTDGTTTTSDVSPMFAKSTTRQTSTYFEHATGTATPTITISFVDPTALTGHRYRLDFVVPDNSAKTYTVTDVDLSATVLSDLPVTAFEGPSFDGMRLSFSDVETAEQNRDLTGWTTGNTTMNVSIRAPRVTLDGQLIQLLATAADYQLVITEAVSDTSAALYGFAGGETKFYVDNLTVGERREFLFNDKNGDGRPSSTETLYLLEPDAQDVLTPSWFFTFVNGSPLIAPEAGDVFSFTTTKPISADDVFEFFGSIGVGTQDLVTPQDLALQQNYPNPFRGTTRIAFAVSKAAGTTLTVYDLLGRTVARLLNNDLPVGTHSVEFNADGLSAGLYFYRLESAGITQTKAMLIVR